MDTRFEGELGFEANSRSKGECEVVSMRQDDKADMATTDRWTDRQRARGSVYNSELLSRGDDSFEVEVEVEVEASDVKKERKKERKKESVEFAEKKGGVPAEGLVSKVKVSM